MTQSRWDVDHDRICLVPDGSSDLFVPTASDIYGCEFRGHTSVDGLSEAVHRPSIDLPHLAFSRFPPDIRIVLTGDDPSNLFATVQGFSLEGASFPLPDDRDQLISHETWWPLESDTIADAWDWLAQAGVKREQPLSLGILLALRLHRTAPTKIVDLTKLSPKDLADAPYPSDFFVPGLRATLYPYQQQGVNFLMNIAQAGLGCLLGDEMGLGKTLQVIGLLTSEHVAGRGPSLVVVPATLVENWRRELHQFNPALAVFPHVGSQRPGVSHYFHQCDVVITSYETAVRDENLLSEISWNLLVVDEAQAIKNPDTARAHALKRIPRRVSIAVSGTPVENSLTDLWSISDFALPGLLGSKSEFQVDFQDDLTSARELSALVDPIILRRRVAEVATDLPNLIEIPQVISMESAHAAEYEAIRLKELRERGTLASITMLRMYCTEPSLVKEIAGSFVSHTATTKFRRFMEILEEIAAADQKALVFTSFTGMIDLLHHTVSEQWPNAFVARINGQTAISERQPIVDAFSKHSGFGVLVLNPQAGGVGLNITSANHVIHYNPEWNPAKTDQASRRAYRRGQELPVTIHHLYYADTIEDWIVNNSATKRELAEVAVQGHDGSLQPSAILDALSASPVATGAYVK